MKKALSLLLLLVMCISVLTSCFGSEWREQQQEAPAELTAAADFLQKIMKDKEGAENLYDYDVVAKVVVDGVTYEVTWTTDNEKVKIVKSSKESYWTVDIPTVNDTAFSYKLIATIKDADGNEVTREFNRKVPVITADNELIVSDPAEGVEYKLFIIQFTSRKLLFLQNATEKGENKFVLGTENAADAAIYKVEKVEGGYKFYTEINGAKNYLTGRIESYKDEAGKDKTSKYLYFSTEDGAVFYYKQNVGAWFTKIDNAEFVLGTYGSFNTASLSEGSFMTEEAVAKQEQFAVNFVKAENTGLINPEFDVIIEPADGTTLTIAEAIELAKKFKKDAYTTGKFVITGTVTTITSTKYGNMMISDGENEIQIYGMYDAANNRFDAMKPQPKEGDVITVKGIVGMYNDPQIKNATILKINGVDYVAQGGASIPEGGLVLDMMGHNTRTEWTADKTVHEGNGITYINNKASSTTANNQNDNGDKATRAYKGSTITIQSAQAFRRIVFMLDTYNNGDYIKGFEGMTLEGATITRKDGVVTISFDEAVTSFVSKELASQIRIQSIAVYETPAEDVGGEEEESDGFTLVTAPQTGVGYYFRLNQQTLGKKLYFVGTTESASVTYRLATTEDANAAVLVYLEAVEGVDGAFRIYFDNAGVKTYIRVFERIPADKSGSLALVTETPAEYFTFDTTYNTPVYTSAETNTKYYINTYNEFTTFSISNDTKVASNYVVSFFVKQAAEEPEDGHQHSYVDTVVAPTCTTKGYTEHKCECGDSYKDTETDVLGHLDENNDKICDRGCGMFIGAPIVAGAAQPVAGTAYKIVMNQLKAGKIVYFLGVIPEESFYGSTAEAANDANVYIAEVEGGFNMYCIVAGVKTYINMVVSGTHVNLSLDAEASTVYTYDATLMTAVAVVNGTNYVFGTRADKTYTTIGPVKANSESYIVNFVVSTEADSQPPHTHNYEAVVTEPTCTEKGYTTYTCACQDSYTADETDALGHLNEIVDNICDRCGEPIDPNHQHDYATTTVVAPTCSAQGYTIYTCACTDSYKDNYTDIVAHKDDDGDYKCDFDGCTEKLLPAADSVLTIEQALKIGALFTENNTYTDGKYYITGTIENFASIDTAQTHGNLYITDGTNDLYVYGIYDITGNIRYDSLPVKPAVGDEITLYGKIGHYNSTQMKSGWLQHSYEAVVTDATCTADGYTTHTCKWCADTYTDSETDALGHNYEDNVCTRCGALDHVHEYQPVVTDPTCTVKGYTTYTCACGDSYKDNETDALGHIDETGDYKCDRTGCTGLVLPEDGATLTIAQALKIGALTTTTQKYYVTGMITEVYNTTYGNMYITDGTDTITVYGLYKGDKNNDGIRYDKLEVKPVAYDTITVYGILTAYNGVGQFKDADLKEHVVHECDYTIAATCTTPAKCGECGAKLEGSELGHEIGDDGACTREGCDYSENSGLTEKNYSYQFTAKQFTANGTKALGDVNWTLAGDGGYWGYDSQNGRGQQLGSGSKPYKSLTLTSDSFSNVTKIVINTSGASSINASFTVSVGGQQIGSSTKLTTTSTEYTFDIPNGATGPIVITYTQSSSKAIYIKSIAVTYAE